MTEHHEKFPQTLAEFGEFINKNQDRFVRHAYFRLGDHQEAEDIVQEVMIKIYQDKDRQQHIARVTSYGFQMVFNACMDHLRKKSRNNFEQLNGKNAMVSVDGSNRETEMIAREEFQRIQKLLRSIPAEQAEVIRLRIIDELSFVEIAQIMKLPVTTIKSRFSYGIIKLQTKVNQQEEIKDEVYCDQRKNGRFV